MSLFGIDLGGTKIEGAVVDPAKPGLAECRLRVPTGGARGYDHVVSQVVKLVGLLERESGVKRPACIGIGTPGAIDPPTGVLKNSNTTCLNGRRLREDLAPGTGCGGGVVVDGRVLDGLHGIAGEWGHNPIRGERTPCYCGRRGCVETAISGPALERFYRERTGRRLSLPEIAARAAGGERAAAATLRRLGAKFGEAIAAVINILDPDAVVIGGGVGNLDLLYGEQTRRA